jgi:excisionase family DNA binding protein
MFEVELKLKFKLNGREGQCDTFVDALKSELTEAVRNTIQQQKSGEGWPGYSSQTERRAYGIDEAAKLLGVHKATISRRIHEGKIKAIRLGGRVLVPPASIQKILRDLP